LSADIKTNRFGSRCYFDEPLVADTTAGPLSGAFAIFSSRTNWIVSSLA